MAETPHKRLREDSHIEDSSISCEFHDSSSKISSKRQKSYNNILNDLLDEEEDEEPSREPSRELSQDLSAIYTTLQLELVSSSTTTTATALDDFDSLPPPSAVVEAELSDLQAASTECGCGGADENDGVKSVMRHLFEATDDELGIPNYRLDEINNNNIEENFPFNFTDHHGLWELEDEAANYYTVLQSELFM